MDLIWDVVIILARSVPLLSADSKSGIAEELEFPLRSSKVLLIKFAMTFEFVLKCSETYELTDNTLMGSVGAPATNDTSSWFGIT